ncbi:glycosyltransferase [Rhodobacteraceae bacterium 63075]|nr:glycosyltransferase [Rhodobacteraceae bacterium 63075]
MIILYNMAREAARSLHSLSIAYQTGVEAEDYEVIVVDNGSDLAPERSWVESFGPNFRYLPISSDEAKPSPCNAINQGVAIAVAPYVGIMIDGARIATPGCINLALDTLQRFDRAVVATIGFHLGHVMQKWAAQTGYSAEVEDMLLDQIGWPENGYRMFEIASLTGVNWEGWFGRMAESNLIFLSRSMYHEIGGFDEGFDLPGGELANLDFFTRATDTPESTLVSLFGEATFHQIHGGTLSAANHEKISAEVARYKARYEERIGRPFRFSTRIPLLVGYPRPEAAGCIAEIHRQDRPDAATPPPADLKYSETL